MKSKPLHWQEPETINCPQCNGSGEFQGMFSSGPCAMCEGTGVVGTDGEPLDTAELLPMMRRQRDRATKRLRALWNYPGVKEAVHAEQERQQRKAQNAEMNMRNRLRGQGNHE